MPHVLRTGKLTMWDHRFVGNQYESRGDQTMAHPVRGRPLELWPEQLKGSQTAPAAPGLSIYEEAKSHSGLYNDIVHSIREWREGGGGGDT